MSDHEDGGSDEWEEGSLPGASAFTFDNSDGLKQAVHDKPNPRRGLLLDDISRPTRSADPSHVASLGRDPLPGIPGRNTGIQARQYQQPEVGVKNAASESRKRREPPSGEHTFTQPWSIILNRIVEQPNGTPKWKIARDRLDVICRGTETYIATPSVESNKASIWGKAERVREAQEQLRIFEDEIREQGVRPHRQNFHKESALDGRKEHRIERKLALSYAELHRNGLGDDLDCDYELYLSWPRDIGLSEFKDEYDSTVIQEVRCTQGCIVRYDLPNSTIQIFSNSEREMYQVHQRIVNLAREMVSRRNEVIRANYVNCPNVESYRPLVKLEARPDGLSIAKLNGDLLLEQQIAAYDRDSRAVRRSNRKKTKRLIERGIKYLQMSQKHVRLRVDFGEIAFKQYKRPSGGQGSHRFEDFVDMLSDERTLLESANGLQAKGKDLIGISDQLDEMLGEHYSTSYLLRFDFRGRAPGSTLRFECEMTPNHLNELEMSTNRWLLFSPSMENEPLIINILDFDKPDFRIRIEALPYPDNKRANSDMDAFTSNIGFEAPEGGIKAAPKPRPRARYPLGPGELFRVTETTVLRWKYKGTDGVLDLRRGNAYDEGHNRKSSTPAAPSTWTVQYYYYHWDNLLGEFEDVKPGESVGWIRSLATFFPDRTEDGKVVDGFKSFMKEVEGVQEMLASMIDSLPEVEVEGNL